MYEIILRAIRQGLDSKAAKLFESNHNNLSLCDKKRLFRESIQYGLHHIIKILFRDVNRSSLIADLKNNLSQIASVADHYKIIQLLLCDEGDDPYVNKNVSTISNRVLSIASERGYDKIVKILLSDRRVDQNSRNNHAIRYACYWGHDKVVKLLLSDEKLIHSFMFDDTINYACKNGDKKIVKLLLSDHSVKLNKYDNHKALEIASKRGREKIIKLLLSDGRINQCPKNSARQLAINYGHSKIVELLDAS